VLNKATAERGEEMEKHAGGRPQLYSNAEELEKLVNDYFIDCELKEKPTTIAGLAYWLEMDRKTLYNYEKKEQFFHIIKRARDKVLANLEELMIEKGNGGTIFLAKNYGYTDKQEIEHTGEMSIINRSELYDKYLGNGVDE
jgi:hypothetical protein